MATQEDVFHAAEGGFAFAFALPHEKGNLDTFKVVRLEAEKKDDSTKLLNKIIYALGEKPRRLLLDRSDQIANLFDSYTERDFKIVIVIQSAHLLTSKTIYELKILREYSRLSFPKSSPAFVLLGHPNEIEALIQVYPGVAMRSSSLPAPELRLVTW